MSLARRLGWSVALITLVACLLPAAALTGWSRAGSARRTLLAEDGLQRDLQAQAEAWTRGLQGQGARLAGELSGGASSHLSGNLLQQWSESVLAGSDLDLLWVLDESGRVEACGHWPAREGTRQGVLAGLDEGIMAVGDLVVRNEDIPALVAVQSLVGSAAGARLVIGLDLLQAAERAAPPAGGTDLEVVPAADSPARRQDSEGEIHGQVAVAGSGLLLLRGRRALMESNGALSWPLLILLCLVPAGTAGSLAAILATRALRPLRELDRMAAALADGRLDLQIETEEGGEIDGLATTVNKMTTSLRRQRDELETTARLAAWRDAARRLAHEVKNPLAPIRMSVENLTHARRRAPERFDELFVEESRTILAEVDALSRLVDTFSRFARQPDPRPREVDAILPLQQVVTLNRDERPGVDLILEPGEDAGLVEIDVDLMGQVLKNLVLNALAVVPRPGGRVSLSCTGEGENIIYKVRDNGPGIPVAIQPRLFEPRVTARPGGTGLGLAVARQIVMAHGGVLEFESSAAGTCFTVRLPRRSAAGKEI
jgi:two-component system nitrogen regulation sensor histidine kinase NtrY